jgi:tetratricopeptide (TPR) repeat protein
MLRSIAVAAGLGALVAALGLYGLGAQPLRDVAALWFAAGGPTDTIALDDLPMCSSMGQLGSDADWAQLDPDFAAGKRALAAEDWHAAIASLKLAAVRDPRNADILNYIGYAHRRLRQLGPAMQYYQQALALNRRHRSAHEHLGELYLLLGEIAKAEEQLVVLEGICLIPCEEYGGLSRSIAAHKALAMR